MYAGYSLFGDHVALGLPEGSGIATVTVEITDRAHTGSDLSFPFTVTLVTLLSKE